MSHSNTSSPVTPTSPITSPLDAWFLKETTAADWAELTQIMDSIRFEP